MASRGDINYESVQPVLSKKWLALGFDQGLTKPGSFVKLNSKEISNTGIFPVVDQGKEKIAGYIDNPELLYKGRTPVIIFGDHTRQIKYIDFEFAVGADGTKLLVPIKLFDPKFFFYYLKALRIPSLGYSRHFKILNGVQLPLPAIQEQQRIVAKLDKLFGHLDALKERLDKIPKLLADFRQAVLSQAVTGKLTEDWRTKNTSQNLDLYIEELRKQRTSLIAKRDDKTPSYTNLEKLEIPNEWKWVRLWDVSYLVTSGSRDWSKYYSVEGANFVRSAEINSNELRLGETIKVKLPEKVEGKRSLIENGNLLITITGANVGKCAKISQQIPESYVSQSVALIKLVDNQLMHYIHLYLLSPNGGGKMLENMAYGMGRPVLNLPQIKSVLIPLPSKQEQIEIVKRVEGLFAKANTIEAKYQLVKEQIDLLPQAILAKAFKGELVEQLPTDGDAQDLLDEIKKLKEEAAREKKKRRNKATKQD